MESQVLLRKRHLHGDPELIRADVLSEDKVNGTLNVRIQGARASQTVQASETISVKSVFGVNPREQRQLPIKCYPESRHALCNSLPQGAC